MSLDTDQERKLFIVQVICLVILWAFIAPLRIWSFVSRKRGRSWKDLPWAEDALMLVALLLYSLMAIFALHGILEGGIGKHASEMPANEASTAFRAWFVCELIYGPLSALVRTSIAVLILRFNPSKLEVRLLYACLIVVYTFTIIYFFINLLQCSPPSYFWKQFEDFSMAGSCGNPHILPNAAITHSVIAAISDFTIAILSACTINRNMMNSPTLTTSDEKLREKEEELSNRELILRRAGRVTKELRQNKTKIVITVFLILGGAAGAVMLARIPSIKILEITPDFLYRTVDVAMWSLIEPCVGIVAGSLPYIRPLCQCRPKRVRDSNYGARSGGTESGTGIWIKHAFTVETRSATPLDDLGGQTMANVLSGRTIVNTPSDQMTVSTLSGQTLVNEEDLNGSAAS